MVTECGCAELRCPHNRRVKQVQRFSNSEIQTLEILLSHIQAALDTYGHSGTKRIVRSLRANLPAGFGTILRTLHHTLSERILHAIAEKCIRMDPTARRPTKNRTKDRPLGFTVVRGGLPPDARIRLPRGSSDTAEGGDGPVPRDGGRVHNKIGFGRTSGEHSGGRQRQTPPTRKRRGV